MDSNLAAYVTDIAPRKKQVEWNQKGIHRVLKKWSRTHSEWYEVVTSEDSGAGAAVGYNIYPNQQGKYGYDTGHHFTPNLDPQFIEREDSEELCVWFYNAWMREIVGIISEEQERSLFSPKEFATLLAHRSPYQSEQRAADALAVTVGTYRGKVGRVKEKIEIAEATLAIDSAVDLDRDKWTDVSYSAALSVIDRVSEDRLPIETVQRISMSGMTLDDFPVDELIRNE
ncbi:hypothetical protein NDI76_19745 [Halogeometricum sp. S1BR25-6]|uniref:Uncharacterized protein n=1 Tax=Halogeometricum salsisoli TaxID=2950536 RepID=A0ABU2GLP6_9EURY|nr:hypothetical protein [Halogeometricum sp. S1BR25-6]MDS0300983.1 hypothetical protein [Halogeometricum sp. S1BR25-6]